MDFLWMNEFDKFSWIFKYNFFEIKTTKQKILYQTFFFLFYSSIENHLQCDININTFMGRSFYLKSLSITILCICYGVMTFTIWISFAGFLYGSVIHRPFSYSVSITITGFFCNVQLFQLITRKVPYEWNIWTSTFVNNSLLPWVD